MGRLRRRRSGTAPARATSGQGGGHRLRPEAQTRGQRTRAAEAHVTHHHRLGVEPGGRPDPPVGTDERRTPRRSTPSAPPGRAPPPATAPWPAAGGPPRSSNVALFVCTVSSCAPPITVSRTMLVVGDLEADHVAEHRRPGPDHARGGRRPRMSAAPGRPRSLTHRAIRRIGMYSANGTGCRLTYICVWSGPVTGLPQDARRCGPDSVPARAAPPRPGSARRSPRPPPAICWAAS